MRKFLLLTFSFTTLISFFHFPAYSQSCVPTNLNGKVVPLSCNTPCTNLVFQVPHLKSTSDYVISSIPFTPFQWLVSVGGTEDPILYADDKYSALYSLPFPFCFYDSTYTKAVIGSNGLITFDETNASTSNAYPITQPIPYAGGTQGVTAPAYYPKAAIMGAFSDLDPRATESPADRLIQWRVEGTAPCRRFIVSYYRVGTFAALSCTIGTASTPPSPTTLQIVMYESTGLIDVFIENKYCTPGTNGGNAILGVQNWNRDRAVAGAGKNGTNWRASNEGYRFTPNGSQSKFVSAELLSMTGTVLAAADTSTTVQGLLDISFPNICPALGSTQYVVRTTFGSCPIGTNMVSLDTITVNRNNTLPVTNILVPTTCGNNVGSITIKVATGVGVLPYQYSINGGPLQLSNIFGNLSAGTYSMYARDALGCDTAYQVTVVASSSLSASTAAVGASCPGATNGSLTVTPTSGTAPYSFTLNNGTPQASGTFTNLPSGTYTVVFVDNLGCSGTVTSTVNPGVPITATANGTTTSCNGASDARITVTASAGIAPYTYSINGRPFQPGNTFSNVSSGPYSITVLDSRNCKVTISGTINAGGSLFGAIYSTPLTCPGANNGTVTLVPSMGVAPYSYRIDGGIAQPSNTFTGVTAGVHTVVFTDANGCSGSRSILVMSGPASGSTPSTATGTSCPGASDGVITITPVAGAVYTLMPGNISNSTGIFTGLAAGSYTATYNIPPTVCLGDVTPASIVVGTGPAITGTATTTPTSCPGATNGTVTVTAPTGPGISYTLNPGAITNTTGIFTGLTANTYTVGFVTAAGCTGTVSVNPVVAPGPTVTGTATATPTSCPGAANGTITVTSPTTAGTTYTLNPGGISNTTGIFTGLAANTYTISFVTGTGCTGTVAVNPVVSPGPAISGTATATPTSCASVSDGTVTVTSPTGAGNTYTLFPGGITNSTGVFTGLAANTYTVNFVTAAGCTGTLAVNPVVAPGPALTGTATATPTGCPGVNNGTIIVTSPAGPGNTYTLNPGAVTNTTGVFTGLAPATYTVSFVTAAGCTGVVPGNLVVVAGPSPGSTFTQVNAVCAGINDGSINIVPAAGTLAPYTVTLTGPGGPYTGTGNAPVSFTNLSPGTYRYSFTDDNGCTGTGGPVNITSNSPLNTSLAVTMPLCYGSSNGTVTLTASGGVAPYQYSLGGTNYQAGNSFNTLAAGTYLFRTRDYVGCTRDTSITLTQPVVLTTAAVSTGTAGCGNNDGAITAVPYGGTAPFSYSISSPGNTSGASTGNFSGLAAGNYITTVRDANGCTASSSATVGLVDNMFLTLGPDTTICQESSVTMQPQVNTEATIFSWKSVNASSATISNPAIKNAVLTPVDTAIYILTAKWGACERTDSVMVNILRKPVAFAGKDTAICNLTYAVLQGSATNTSGPVSYSWSPIPGLAAPGQATTTVNPTGNNTTYSYTLTVTDDYGCRFSVTDVVNVRVQHPVPAFAGNDTIAIKGVPHQLFGSGGKSYTWSPSYPINGPFNQNPTTVLQNDTKFTLEVTDLAGCVGWDTVFVKVYTGPTYYIPNAFTPNGDGLNDIFRAIPVGIANTEWFRIFNRYGEQIFQTNQWLKGWDGTFKGKKQPIGAYVWIIKGTDRYGKVVEMKGTVMLLQ